jgi:hypothetical protein
MEALGLARVEVERKEWVGVGRNVPERCAPADHAGEVDLRVAANLSPDH